MEPSAGDEREIRSVPFEPSAKKADARRRPEMWRLEKLAASNALGNIYGCTAECVPQPSIF